MGDCSGTKVRPAAPMEKAMKKLMTFLAMASAVSVSAPALAHGEKPRHGGVLQTANDIAFELVNKDGAVTIYVEDHGNKVFTTGATGKLTVLNGTEKSEVPLEPAGENMLVTKGDAQLAKNAKAIVAVTFADKKTVNIRFVVK